MIRFEMDVAAADQVGRTIEGMIVPYGEVGRIAGVQYRFLPGSVKLARSRVPLLMDHERSRPVGVLAELTDTDKGALGRFTVDNTPDGDLALAQAATGSRGALSVGASVEASLDNGGVLDVTAGLVHEVSLLALGAFAGAEVTSVAAQEDPPPDPPMPDEPPPAPPAPDTPEPEEEPAMPDTVEATVSPPAPQVMIAARGAAPVRAEIGAGELVTLIIRAQHGEPDARRYLEAALTETISTDVSGLLPPTYERTVIGGKSTPRPLYNLFRSRSLPGVGLAVTKPKWTTFPVGAWAATVDADATSTKIAIGTQTANVLRWDWAGAFSWVVVQRSDPSMIDEAYGQAVDNFYLAVETSIATILAAAATDTSTSLGAAVGKFFATNKRTPDAIIVAPDVWGKMADRAVLQAPVAGPSSVGTGGDGLTAMWAGIPVYCSASLAATFAYLVTRRAIDARITEPVQLTANAIGALNVELAVVGEGLFDTDYASEIMELAPTIPLADAVGGSKSK